MAEHISHPGWRKENEPTNFPFASSAGLTTDGGVVMLEGTLLDAAIYPVGGRAGMYLSRVVVGHSEVTLYVGDAGDASRCSGTFPIVNPPDSVALADASGRPAGLLVSESRRLGVFTSWGVGTHTFRRAQSEFAASVCLPTPGDGLRGVRLETGEVLVGDVWLVGGDGVVFREDEGTIRLDVVGDPLFRRRLCTPGNLFATPRFITSVEVIGPNGSFTCSPDASGDLKLVANNRLASDAVVRVVPTASGLKIGAAGDVT